MTVAERTPQDATKRQRGYGLTAALAEKYEIEPAKFLETIQQTVMPSSASHEDLVAFLMVAKEYDLNPLLKEIHAFPKKGGGIQPIVGVDGWVKILHRQDDFDGMEFDYSDDEDGNPISITCIIYKKKSSHPVKIEEFYDECKRPTEPWKTMPRRMLRHKALMQCARVAFGLAGIMDEDEAKDITEIQARVIEDDPLKPGRHERKRRTAPPHTVEPTEEEIAAASARREELKRQAEEAEQESSTESKPQAPEAYNQLYRLYDEHAKLVDSALDGVGLKSMLDLEWRDLDPAEQNKLKQAALKVKDALASA